MIAHAFLPSLPSPEACHLGGHCMDDIAVLYGHWGRRGELTQWFRGADLPARSQPHGSNGAEGTVQGRQGSPLSLAHPLSTRPDACWPDEAAYCSLFHNLLMKCG